MTLEQFVEAKVEKETNKIKAYKELWENKIKNFNLETYGETYENAAYEQWEDEFNEYTNTFGDYIFHNGRFMTEEEIDVEYTDEDIAYLATQG